jgi:rod shape-determining protein MreD
VKLMRGLMALGAACLVQILLSRYLPSLGHRCDLFSILVVYYGLTRHQTAAMIMGSCAGLVQDSLVGSLLLGMNGFKKTLVGYLVGSFGSLFMLNQAIPRFGILFGATFLDPLTELIVSTALGRSFAFPAPSDLVQLALGNGIVGLLVFWIAARIP